MRKNCIFIILFLNLNNIVAQPLTINGSFKTENKKISGFDLEFFNFKENNVEYLLYSCDGKWTGIGKYYIKGDSLHIDFDKHPNDTSLILKYIRKDTMYYNILNINITFGNNSTDDIEIFICDSLSNIIKVFKIDNNNLCSVKLYKKQPYFIKIKQIGLNTKIYKIPKKNKYGIFNCNIYLSHCNFFSEGSQKKYYIISNRKYKLILKNDYLQKSYKKIPNHKFITEKKYFFKYNIPTRQSKKDIRKRNKLEKY